MMVPRMGFRVRPTEPIHEAPYMGFVQIQGRFFKDPQALNPAGRRLSYGLG